MKPYKIRIEHGRTEASRVCITESARPGFSWAVAAGEGEHQTAYCLTVSQGEKKIWDSGWREDTGQQCRYDGEKLEAGEIYTLRLRLKNQEGAVSGEAGQDFCPGKLETWEAGWICEQEERKNGVAAYIGDFSCEKEVASACLFVCGLGYHKVYLNGEAVFTDPMNPAYSQYDKRTYYTVLPGLEKLLQQGSNRLGIRVAGGWRNDENICYQLVNRIPAYVGKRQLSAQLRIRYSDGSVEWKRTDTDWKYFYDPVVSADIFLGERYEAEQAGADSPGQYLVGFSRPGTASGEQFCCSQEPSEGAFEHSLHADPENLFSAAAAEPPGGRMEPQTLEYIREQEIYAAKSVCQVESKVWLVDFGQNIAGVCRIRIPEGMEAGQEITIRHMEFLDEEHRLYLPQLRNAASVDTYVASGREKEPGCWQPEFTYHGFRYAEVTGYPEALLKEDICAVSLYTDAASAGYFTCGNALIDKIYRNAVQTEKANIHSILTDCPQRDERVGWMNDATVRFEATPYSFDVGRLFPKVVRDCMDVQDEDGSITCTAPFAFGCRPADPVCSSYLIAAWQAYLHTGNLDIIGEGYEGFCRWNRFLAKNSVNNIVNYSYYGDWAAPAYACASEEYAVSAVTPGELMSTGYYYYNTCLLMQMAEKLGMEEEVQKHRQEAEEIAAAFLEKWYDAESGKVATGSQGCQSFALWLGILPEEGRQKAADYLHQDLVEKEYRFTTGNLCTRYMMEMLTRYGYLEDAWKLAVREEYPSFGFMIQNEATTIWERFELKKNPTMNSHNHPMYGAVVYWYYAFLAGIRPLEPGWSRFRVQPYLPEKLLSASAAAETPYGDVYVRWTRRYGETHLYVDVPHGTEAEVILPWGGRKIAQQGFHHWKN